MKQFEFIDLVNPKVFSTWNGVAPPEKSEKCMEPFLISQCFRATYFIYNDKDFHKVFSYDVLKYIFKFKFKFLYLKIAFCQVRQRRLIIKTFRIFVNVNCFLFILLDILIFIYIGFYHVNSFYSSVCKHFITQF